MNKKEENILREAISCAYAYKLGLPSDPQTDTKNWKELEENDYPIQIGDVVSHASGYEVAERFDEGDNGSRFSDEFRPTWRYIGKERFPLKEEIAAQIEVERLKNNIDFTKEEKDFLFILVNSEIESLSGSLARCAIYQKKIFESVSEKINRALH
jgi:hypothetical protein